MSIHVPIISTGRSGSMLLATALNFHPSVSISYISMPDFLYHSSGLFHGRRARGVYTHPEDATRRGEQLAGWDDVRTNSRPIVLVRDPRDMICSWREFAARSALDHYRADLDTLTVQRLAEFWEHVYGILGPCLVVHYEDLIDSLDYEVDLALDYLGLSPKRRIDGSVQRRLRLMFAQHGTSPSPKDSVGRWRRALSDTDVSTILSICGQTMYRFDYPYSLS